MYFIIAMELKIVSMLFYPVYLFSTQKIISLFPSVRLPICQ